jgi:hypothetical protein
MVQVFRAKGLRHPSAGLHLSAGATFIPNDVELAGDEAPFIILTGPNMGGAAPAWSFLSAHQAPHTHTHAPSTAGIIMLISHCIVNLLS